MGLQDWRVKEEGKDERINDAVQKMKCTENTESD